MHAPVGVCLSTSSKHCSAKLLNKIIFTPQKNKRSEKRSLKISKGSRGAALRSDTELSHPLRTLDRKINIQYDKAGELCIATYLCLQNESITLLYSSYGEIDTSRAENNTLKEGKMRHSIQFRVGTPTRNSTVTWQLVAILFFTVYNNNNNSQNCCFTVFLLNKFSIGEHKGLFKNIFTDSQTSEQFIL